MNSPVVPRVGPSLCRRASIDAAPVRPAAHLLQGELHFCTLHPRQYKSLMRTYTCGACKKPVAHIHDLVTIDLYHDHHELCRDCTAPIRSLLARYKLAH